MYWPIGAPRIYAASNNAAQADIQVFDDDIESQETVKSPASTIESAYFGNDEPATDELFLPPATPITPITPAIKPVEQDHDGHFSSAHRSDGLSFRTAENQPLLALKASKTGHLFAVITTSSLTVWQTKVGTHKTPQSIMPNFPHSLRQFWQSSSGRRSR